MIEKLTDLITQSARKDSDASALIFKAETFSYGMLADAIDKCAANLAYLGLEKYDRVGIFAGKQPETVIAALGATRAGGAFVPINPLFKANQVSYILRDCNIRILVTTQPRLRDIVPILETCPDLRHIVVTTPQAEVTSISHIEVLGWNDLNCSDRRLAAPRLISSDMAAIMYTSGSTGQPKGVVLSHGNLTIGAQSVASYIGNTSSDRILAILPFSFDAGFSQLTTGFSAGACVVLHDYLLAGDVVRIVERERISGITGVPPLWMQLAEQTWPNEAASSVRYFANTGGKMPLATLNRLRQIFKNATPFLMYGLTESFRSTYLPPSEVDRRPDSIGIAVPNAEVLVIAKDGSVCGPNEPGELVHRGPLVSLGYWNDPERTAKRFRPAPTQPAGISNMELAVWSGDTVSADEDGFLYFVGREDDMIKTSGYRISPTEIEDAVFDTGLVAEVAALGVPHEQLGQAIVILAKSNTDDDSPTEELLNQIRRKVPNYMVPHVVQWKATLPRNANGKLDRKAMTAELQDQLQNNSEESS